MFKRVLSAILAVVMVLSMLPALGLFTAVSAATTVTATDSAQTLTNKLIYYENDFESGSSKELTLKDGAGLNSEEEENRLIDMPVNSWFLWNYTEIWDLGAYTVFEMKIRTSDIGTLHIYVNSENGKQFRPAVFRKTGEVSPSHKATGSKLLAHETVCVAVAINSVDNTYSVWFDDVLVTDNKPIADCATGVAVPDFGEVRSIRVNMTDGTHYSIDDIKVYDGLTPDDYDDAVAADPQEEDEEWLKEWQGKESPVLDYATDALAVINAADAIMVNTDTFAIYQDGQKRDGTKAEVDAILADTAGKTVVKNDYGLVIISDAALNLTDAQKDSLQDYMVYTRPKAAMLKELYRMSGEHPRIILNQDKLDQIRADYQTDSTVKKWADNVIATANGMLKEAHVSEGGGRTIRDRGMNLSMAYLLTGDTKYKDFLWTDLELAGNFDDWSHLSSLLTTSDFAVGFAVAYDWLYNDWTEEQRTFLEESLYKHALFRHHRYMYGKGYGLGTFITSTTNRNAVCNGGMGLASIALFDKYEDKCADILEKTYHMLEYMLGEFAPDGAAEESPDYWEYEMRYLVPFLASTELTFGSDFNILETPGFDMTADYYLDVDGMAGLNNYHDGTAAHPAGCGELFWFAQAFEKDELAELFLYGMDKRNVKGDIYSLIYFDSSTSMPESVAKALDAYYEKVELVTMRSSWLDKLGIYVSAHTGVTNVSHGHADSGSFVLDIGGQRFGGDLGKEDYALRASGSNRYYYYRNRPEGHNVFVINPSTALGQNIYATQVVSEFVRAPRGAYAILPLDSAYSVYATGATRGIMLGDDRSSVLIRDEIKGMTQDTNEVWWFMQMENVTTTISEDKKSAVLTKNGVDVHVQVASDNATDWEIKELGAKTMHPKEDLVDTELEDENEGWTRLAIVFTAGKDLNINVKFAELGNAKGDTAITQVALADWAIEDGEMSEDYVAGGTCGTNANWTLTADGTLTISGDGAMADYASGTAPWYEYRSQIKAINIKSHVTSIGKYAFYNCTALTSVTIPGNVATIGQNAFRSCAALTDVVICNGVVTIDAKAFISCPKLARISIPVSVTNIGQQAFYSCKAIATVSYCGTDEQWNAITIDTNNDYLKNATRQQHSFVGGTCQSCGEKVAAYTVTWNIEGVTTETSVEHGQIPVYPNGEPTKVDPNGKINYTFAGWDINGDNVADEPTAITGDVIYTALFDVSNISVKTKALELNDLVCVLYKFYITPDVYTDEYLLENAGILIWQGEQIFEGQVYEKGTESYPVVGLTKGTDTKGDYYQATANGVAAKNLVDQMICRGYIKKSNGDYEYTPVMDYNALTYASNMLAKPAMENWHPLLVSLLNYGAAAQIWFNYKTDNLINKDLTDKQRELVVYDSSYIEKLDESCDKFNQVADISYEKVIPSLELEMNINIFFKYQLSEEVKANIENIKMLYWSEEVYEKAVRSNFELNVDNATGKADLEEADSGRWSGTATGIAPRNMGQTYYACLYTEDAEGVGHYSALKAYSIHQYASKYSTNSNENLANLCKAILSYSHHAAGMLGTSHTPE